MPFFLQTDYVAYVSEVAQFFRTIRRNDIPIGVETQRGFLTLKDLLPKE